MHGVENSWMTERAGLTRVSEGISRTCWGKDTVCRYHEEKPKYDLIMKVMGGEGRSSSPGLRDYWMLSRRKAMKILYLWSVICILSYKELY